MEQQFSEQQAAVAVDADTHQEQLRQSMLKEHEATIAQWRDQVAKAEADGVQFARQVQGEAETLFKVATLPHRIL